MFYIISIIFCPIIGLTVMSKRCKKENKRRLVISGATDCAKSNKIDHESSLVSLIGSANVKRWNDLKIALKCGSDEYFVKLLLDFAENHINRNNNDQLLKHGKSKEVCLGNKTDDKFKQNPVIHDEKKEQDKIKAGCKGKEVTSGLGPEKLVVNVELCNSNVESALASRCLTTAENKNNIVPTDLISNQSEKLERKKDSTQPADKFNKKPKSVDKRIDKPKKKVDVDIRKAPELNAAVSRLKCAENMDVVDVHVKCEEVDEDENVAIKIKLCNSCNCGHLQDHCPLQFPHYAISDALTADQVKPKSESKSNDNDENEASEEDSVKHTFSCLSLPYVLGLVQTNTVHGLGVVCKEDVKQFTEFGPLVGKVVKEVDISEDSTMRDVWEINAMDGTHVYMSTEDLQHSNWMRFVRPAPSRDARNICAVSKSSKLYFVTMKNLTSGEELLYWQDDTINSLKKKMEKTSCGGCNMNFTHPLYYRLHCSIFHDMRYSLTIRKYHCKVCGAAILGKENIMKHAAELHNGQGAYQCQFCKKFFLRLNYLEMHRTYGCSANPHRSRPLCDFCGRKFCQPQKLKVHIKRMHSDMSEVLKEFQCKNCLKILGSPAALQRHLKEVHQKQVDGACACSKCGKLFQNKSNLKIHMLTHSGIKPFKCMEKKCIAAFTTKQCLQFHYKKVHGLAEDMMPKIERSIDYTFEAYSGLEDYDSSGNANKVETSPMKSDSFRCSSNASEVDENSMDEKVVEDPLALHSPIHGGNEHSSESNGSPPTLEAFAPSMKILTKGSKKWIAEESLQIFKSDLYHVDKNRNCKTEEAKTISLDVDEPQVYDTPKLNTNLNAYNRHESSNASLLVEAALDSVCSEPNIDIDVNSTTNCTDALVNNLYTLSHADMPDVTYSHSVDMSESRDINLISPSVNDHISVTDDLNDELKNTHNMGIDYSNFQQEDFSPPSSPNVQNRNNFVRDYINVNVVSPQNYETSVPKNLCQIPSPPRYNFTHNINADQSSDDSNGIGAQNLSVHNSKDSIQLDLSIYKSHYNLDAANFQFRKDFRIKFDAEPDRKQVYILDVDNVSKSYNDVHKFNLTDNDHTQIANLQGELSEKDFENVQDVKHKDLVEPSIRTNLSDLRNKFDLDLDVRSKSYDNGDNCDIRSRNLYDSTVDDFRIKNYDLIENLDTRNTLDGRNLLDSEFRSDRNFDHLVLNTSELQGLDMSARSYHSYSNLNRYHHLYSEVERPSVDLRLNYSSPPPTYTHADILRVVSLDLTPPGRHSVDLSLRSHQIANSRILSDHGLQSNSHRISLDQGRILTNDLSTTRHLSPETRLLSVSDMSNRILSDHTTNRLLSVSNDVTTNRLITTDDSRLISEQPRLLDQSRMLGDGRIIPPGSNNAAISPVPYSGYSVSPSPYHPTALPPRSPNSTPYHHYSTYY